MTQDAKKIFESFRGLFSGTPYPPLAKALCDIQKILYAAHEEIMLCHCLNALFNVFVEFQKKTLLPSYLVKTPAVYALGQNIGLNFTIQLNLTEISPHIILQWQKIIQEWRKHHPHYRWSYPLDFYFPQPSFPKATPNSPKIVAAPITAPLQAQMSLVPTPSFSPHLMTPVLPPSPMSPKIPPSPVAFSEMIVPKVTCPVVRIKSAERKAHRDVCIKTCSDLKTLIAGLKALSSHPDLTEYLADLLMCFEALNNFLEAWSETFGKAYLMSLQKYRTKIINDAERFKMILTTPQVTFAQFQILKKWFESNVMLDCVNGLSDIVPGINLSSTFAVPVINSFETNLNQYLSRISQL